MNIDSFKTWIVEKDIETRTIEGFWKSLSNYQQEEQIEFAEVFEAFDKEKIEVNIDRISLNLANWPLCRHNNVCVHIPILYMKQELGYYELLFDLSGEVIDDYFVIY